MLVLKIITTDYTVDMFTQSRHQTQTTRTNITVEIATSARNLPLATLT